MGFAVALAVVHWRRDLAAHGVWIGVVGLVAAVGGAMGTTWLLNVTNVIPPETNLLNKPLLEERVNPGWYSVIAAVAAGIAGALGTTEQRTDTLVGVVASVALVPAAAAAGIALLSEDPTRGWGGIVLVSVNVVLIVLTAIAVLLIIRSDWRPDP